MKGRPFCQRLERVFAETPLVPASRADRFLIVSDLHLGDGGSRDDFRPNAEIFRTVLERFYLPRGYRLILNGDIEELQRFPMERIVRRWQPIYRLFEAFAAQNGLYRIVGNHDRTLAALAAPPGGAKAFPALKLEFDRNIIFIFHGHQATLLMDRFNLLCGLVLRYIANPIGIKNYARSHRSKVRFQTERRVYGFSRDRKIVSLIGHTHRPLFESLSPLDALQFKIEQLCREYARSGRNAQGQLAGAIRACQSELSYWLTMNRAEASRGSLYNRDLLVPCLFNTGAVIGKQGFTALEIDRGLINLAQWTEPQKTPAAAGAGWRRPAEPLEGSDYCRIVLKQEQLDYIFARIKLLA
jgi:predicted phosphodiesterase